MIAERELVQRLLAGPVSGDELAHAHGLTRAAIWKRVNALREAGLEIEASPGRGYRLDPSVELLDPARIEACLPAGVRTGLAALEVAWSLDSTNSELLRRSTPAQGVVVLLAERQTGGRGRRGRDWKSPLAANLYLSVARQYGGGLAKLGGLSLVAGIAVAEALREHGHAGVGLKWPNDLVVAGRKLGGLLVEGGGEHAGPVRAVVGIGLNVRMPAGAAAGIDQAWTDLQQVGGPPALRNALATRVLAHLLPALEAFDAHGLTPFLPRYAALDILAGRAIDILEANGTRHGVAEGLAEDGALRVRIDGVLERLHAGDVSVRGQ